MARLKTDKWQTIRYDKNLTGIADLEKLLNYNSKGHTCKCCGKAINHAEWRRKGGVCDDCAGGNPLPPMPPQPYYREPEPKPYIIDTRL